MYGAGDDGGGSEPDAERINASEIIEKTFYEKTFAQNQILGRALFESFLFMDGKCIVSYITQRMMEFHGVTPKDLEGIVSQLRVNERCGSCRSFI